MQRLRAKMMSRPHLVARAPVNWGRLIFRYTDTKTREHLAHLQSKFAEITGLYATVPKAVEPIDWGYWQKTIRTPGVVDQFRKEYEQEMVKEVKLNPSDEAAKKQRQEQEIRTFEAKAETSGTFLSELDSEIAWTKQWHDNPTEVIRGTWISWNKFKRDNYYPNYKIHRMNRLLFLGDPFQRDARPVDRINSVDLVELRKQLDNGNVRALAAIAPMADEVGDLTALQRPFVKKWMKPIDYEAAFKNPNTSLVYRAYALKQINEGGR